MGGLDEGNAAAPGPFDSVRKVVAGEPELSLEDLSDQSGLPRQILREVLTAAEWADRPAYDERDVAYARDIARMLDYYPLDTVIRSIRMRHRAMASIVVSDLGAVRDRIVRPALASGASPTELGEQFAATAQEILPLSTRHLAEDYRRVLLRLLDTEAVASGALSPDRELDLAIGFVDVAGYTALSGRMDPEGLDHVLASFEQLVADKVADAPGVLLAKFIGDAAMLVSSDPLGLCQVLLDLVSDRERLAEAPRSAGMAAGPVLVREGDYFGPTTNLAARLTDHARPWSLLVDEDVEGQLGKQFSVNAIPATEIRGVGKRRPLRVRADS